MLAPDRTWIGDCMRREPTKRDTYERFAANSAETATHAARSFERLWRAAVPVQQLPPLPAALASQLPGFAGSAAARGPKACAASRPQPASRRQRACERPVDRPAFFFC